MLVLFTLLLHKILSLFWFFSIFQSSENVFSRSTMGLEEIKLKFCAFKKFERILK